MMVLTSFSVFSCLHGQNERSSNVEKLTAGIDLALALIEEDHGFAVAKGVAQHLWDDDGANLVDHLAGVEDLEVAAATYRAACRRWPKAKITLRQGARVVDKSW